MSVYILAYDLRYVLIIFFAFIEHKSKANIGFLIYIFHYLLTSTVYLTHVVFLFHQVSQGSPDPRVLKDYLVAPERKEKMANQAKEVLKVLKVTKGSKARKATEETEGQEVKLGGKVKQVRREIKDLLETKAPRVLMVLKETVGKKEREGTGDLGGLKVPRERKGTRE